MLLFHLFEALISILLLNLLRNALKLSRVEHSLINPPEPNQPSPHTAVGRLNHVVVAAAEAAAAQRPERW